MRAGVAMSCISPARPREKAAPGLVRPALRTHQKTVRNRPTFFKDSKPAAGRRIYRGHSMQDPLFGNKVAAAVLTALILIFGLPQLTKALTGGGHHGGGHGGELHLAYGGDIELETSAGPAEEAPKVDLGTLLANASVAAGERRAALCKSCHTFEEGGANGTGPNLWGIVNHPVAGHAGFNYSGALKEAGGVWSYDRLDAFLKNSQEYIPGTAMVQRFAKDEQRADLLAYLGSLSSDPVPYPAPAPVAEAPAADEHGAEDGDQAGHAEEAPAEEEHAEDGAH